MADVLLSLFWSLFFSFTAVMFIFVFLLPFFICLFSYAVYLVSFVNSNCRNCSVTYWTCHGCRKWLLYLPNLWWLLRNNSIARDCLVPMYRGFVDLWQWKVNDQTQRFLSFPHTFYTIQLHALLDVNMGVVNGRIKTFVIETLPWLDEKLDRCNKRGYLGVLGIMMDKQHHKSTFALLSLWLFLWRLMGIDKNKPKVDTNIFILNFSSTFCVTNLKALAESKLKIMGAIRSTTSTSSTSFKEKNFSCKTKRMDMLLFPRASSTPLWFCIQRYPDHFTSCGRRQLAEWKKLLLKIEFNSSL